MRASDSLRIYISYFQNQLAKVHNCSENASALAFISGLQITHPLYKHMVKYNVTRWNEFYTESSHISNWKRQWKALPTYLLTAVKTEQNQSHSMEAPPLTSRDADQVLSRNNRARTLSRANPELTKYLIASPCWSSQSRTFSKPSKINPGWSVRRQTRATLLTLKWETTVPFITKRDTKLLNASFSASILKILSSRAISESTSLYPEPPLRQKDSRRSRFHVNRSTWSPNIERLTKHQPEK